MLIRVWQLNRARHRERKGYGEVRSDGQIRCYTALQPKKMAGFGTACKGDLFLTVALLKPFAVGVYAFFINGDLLMLCGELGMSITGLLC